MRYSQLFGQSRRNVASEIESINGQLLQRAGYIEPIGAGIVAWLPLGLRVLRRVEQIIRQELDALGCQEVLLPALQPKRYWEQTKRWDSVDILFKLTSSGGHEYGLGPTHEEIITPIARQFIHSYRDLPVAVYQIQTKYRDELRAKGGVLRGREFGMKDCYSFHATRKDFQAFYDRMLGTYRTIYERCGVPPTHVQASGGDFTEKFSDEFHVETPSGEDDLVICRSTGMGCNAEVADRAASRLECPEDVETTKGVEVGNTFDLETKFADAFDLAYTDEHGKRHPVVMGCYGIGTTRLVGAIVEASHDERGIIWPASVAPYDFHVVSVEAKSDEVTRTVVANAETLVAHLERSGRTVLYDDRIERRVGEKLADADLLGIPMRIVVSPRSLEAGGFEVSDRATGASRILDHDSLLKEFTV
jgi:prolyl-tRNA synthetase